MKPIKILTLVIGTITLFPSASFADLLHGSCMSMDLSPITIGDKNITGTTKKDFTINSQKSDLHPMKVSGANSDISPITTDHCNINFDGRCGSIIGVFPLKTFILGGDRFQTNKQ
jgi:hypothetical protein